MPRFLPSLLLCAVICLPACRSQPADISNGDSRAWMEQKPPGPYRTVTVGSGPVERCVSCHRFQELSTIPSFLPGEPLDTTGAVANEPVDPLSPQAVHPAGWLAWHEFNETGCIACHGGNPAGLSYAAAGHARMFDNNTEIDGAPVEVAREARCGRCHEGELLPAAPMLSEGRALIRELNCSACHDLPDWLSGGSGGPDLGRVGQKYTVDLLAELPRWVQQFKPGSRMPEFSLEDQEAADLAAYLAAGNIVLKQQSRLPVVRVDDPAALQLLVRSRCVNCHGLPPLPAEIQKNSLPEDVAQLWELPQGSLGPSLERIGQRLSGDWIADLLRGTHAWYPGGRMPDYALEPDQAELLAGWLVAASQAAGHQPVAQREMPAGDAARGAKLFIEQGCAGCHLLGGESQRGTSVGPSLLGIGDKMKVQWQLKAPEIDNLYDYLAGNMADPPAVGNPRMPRFALDEHQLRAIVTALLAEPQAGAVRLPPLRPTRPQDLQPLKSDWQAYWAYPVPPQGSGDHRLSGLERELRPESCAVCHRQQYAEWQGTRHSLAMGPGIVGQIVDMDSAGYSSCLKCHAVLSEQQHVRRLEGDWQDNPDYQDSLYLSGISCASCHLRAHTRFAAQNTQQKYPWDPEGLTAHPLERTGLLESSDFCWNCHQFAEDRTIADGNPPLQNTNVEHRNWQAATGDPRSCQDCHMPEGRHTFQGIHSAQYVRESLDLQAELTDGPDGPIARLTIGTQEVGHYFPTYVTPAVFVEMELLDAAGRPIEGSFQQQRIQRDARTRDDGNGQREWYDESDTRLPPGSITDIDFGISQADYPEARQVRLELRVEPDYFYHHAYGRWIKDGSRSEQGRDMLKQAMRETGRESSGYTLYEARLDLD